MSNNSSKLISLMFIIGQRMREEMKHRPEWKGVSWLHFEALRYIEESGKPTMRTIAAHFSITPPAATLLVDGLVANGLLRRTMDAKDRRTVRIALTAKGRALVLRGIRQRVETIKKVFSVLNTKEHEELVRMLGKIAKNN